MLVGVNKKGRMKRGGKGTGDTAWLKAGKGGSGGKTAI